MNLMRRSVYFELAIDLSVIIGWCLYTVILQARDLRVITSDAVVWVKAPLFASKAVFVGRHIIIIKCT